MITFHPYGFFIGIAILVSASISEKYRKKFSSYQLPHFAKASRGKPATSYQLLWWVLIPGLIGARLYHVLDYWDYYSKDLIKIFCVWEGGLGIIGGIVGGIIGLGTYSFVISWRRLNSRAITQLLNLLDVAIIGLPVGQAIGRLGNFFNQELYGLPTDLAWGIYIGTENRLPSYESFEKFHPLFVYEAIWCLIIFIIIISFIKVIKKRKEGLLFFFYLGLYSFGRFWLEFLRIESWTIALPLVNWHLRVAQLISIIFIIISLAFLFKKRWKVLLDLLKVRMRE